MPETTPLVIFVFASDQDGALELAGNAADEEFFSLEKALKAYDPEYHSGKAIYRIVVEKVAEAKNEGQEKDVRI